MADEKWSQFSSGGALQDGDQVVGLRSGKNLRFNANTIVDNSSANAIFVSQDGSDTNGTGTILQPYATVAHAMTTITGNTSSNTFNIIVAGGVITETAQILLKPFVGISSYSQETVVNQSTAMGLDASYLSSGSATTTISNITMTGGITLNFSTASATAAHVIDIISASIGSLTLNANSNAFVTLTVSNCGLANVTVDNCIFVLEASVLNNLTAGSNTAIRQLQIISTGNTFSGNVALSATISGFLSNCQFTGCIITGTVTLTNPLTNWYVDVSTYKAPTIVNGAVVQLINISDGLLADYTPSHYTPTATPPTLTTSVQAHLHGIDNSLSAIANPGTLVYVANSGSDSTGTGSFNNPYQTIAHAMTSITTASYSNVFTIVLLSNVYNELNQIALKDNVNIFAYTTNAYINNSQPIVISSTGWNGNSGNLPISSYINLAFNLSAGVALDFSVINPTTGYPKVYFINCFFYYGFSINGGTNSYNSLRTSCYTYNCYFAPTITIDNMGGYFSYSGEYVGTLNFGSVSVVNANIGHSSGDYIAGGLNLAGTAGAGAQIYYLSSCLVTSMTVGGNNITLSTDATSYVKPTGAGTPTVTFRTIASSLAGTTTTDNAPTGNLGQYVINTSSAGNLSSGVATNISSISLTAGDWEVSGAIDFHPASTTLYTQIATAINTTSATLPTFPVENNIQLLSATFGTNVDSILSAGPTRISIGSTTTVYLVGRATFSVSTLSATGVIKARRVR